MYFGPGVHRPKDLPNNQIRIPSNTTVYLARERSKSETFGR